MSTRAAAVAYGNEDDDHLSAIDFGRIARLVEGEAGIKLPPGKRLMVEGRLRKFLNEIALIGQPFVKDPDTTIAKLLKDRGAKVHRYVRLEVGEGIEKKQENIAEAVAAMRSQG